VLKDENTLATHNIKDSGIAVNMVRAAAKKPEPAAEAQVRFTSLNDLWGSISHKRFFVRRKVVHGLTIFADPIQPARSSGRSTRMLRSVVIVR
jgi:hypothetical protein